MSTVQHNLLPDAAALLNQISADKPLAIILVGHNGSGKSTFWSDKLADSLQIPLINADRLTLSILPEPKGTPPSLRPWAARLRDNDERWQRLSQSTVSAVVEKVIAQNMPFAYETVFSHLKELPDGTFESKAERIAEFQLAGYSVALLFVGLANPALSVVRVSTRRSQGGHNVPIAKLLSRFPRTQTAIGLAAPLADLTLMFDNSRGIKDAFTLVRVQAKTRVLYDCRIPASGASDEVIEVASSWLSVIAPLSVNE